MIDIQELKSQQNIFGKIIGKTIAGYPITTYGYIRSVNCQSVIFEDNENSSIKFRVTDVKSFEPY